MKAFVAGVAGGVGRRVVERLLAGGHAVTGIVRRSDQAQELAKQGITARIADLATDSVETLSDGIRGCDVVLFTAGAGGKDGPDATTAIDGDGPAKLAAASKRAGVRRFYFVSDFPEAWRDRRMGHEFEHYMAQKKKADSQIVLTDLEWVILRPSALTDEPGVGTIDLGLAKMHGEIRRDDVAETLVALMEKPELSRLILEVTGGSTPVGAAVAALAM